MTRLNCIIRQPDFSGYSEVVLLVPCTSRMGLICGNIAQWRLAMHPLGYSYALYRQTRVPYRHT